MKLRRGLAISAISTVLSVAAISASPAAFADGAGPTISPVAGPSNTDLSSQVNLTLKGLPKQVVAGGPTVGFELDITNSTGGGAVFFPMVQIGTEHNLLSTAQQKLQYQDPDTLKWLDAQAAPTSGDPEMQGLPIWILGKLDPDGLPTDDSLIYLSQGETLPVKLRLTVTANAKPDNALAVAMSPIFPVADDNTLGFGGGAISNPVDFSIVAAGSSAPASPSAPASSPASVPASAPASVSVSISASTPASAPTGSASASAPASTPPSKKPSPSQSASAKPAPSASATIAAPVTVPPIKTPATTAVGAAKSRASARTAKLASTGGGSDSGMIAAVGAAAVALGVGTLVVLRRRKSGAHS